MAARRESRRRLHPLAWVADPLREEPSFVERPMFGARAVYLHGRLMLVLCARGREPWQGLLVPTDRERHAALRREHASLRPHPVLGKWLYLPESSDDFEETAATLAEAAQAGDPRLGVEPQAKAAKRRVHRRKARGLALILTLGMATQTACQPAPPSPLVLPRAEISRPREGSVAPGSEATTQPPAQTGSGAGSERAPAPSADRRAEQARAAERERYVREIAARIARHAPPVAMASIVYVADTPEPNAFALPNGRILVSRGLLALANDEDELANVLGHELAHVVANHHAIRQAAPEEPGLLGALRALGMWMRFDPGALAAYSREQEREADRRGQLFAERAGADPAAMARFLHALESVERLRTLLPRRPTFLDTHPTPRERAAAATDRAGADRGSASALAGPRRERFLERLEGLLLGENPANGLVQGAVFLHPDLGFSIRFPPKWEIANRPDAVLARSPAQDALIELRYQQPGSDPEPAARAYLAAHHRTLTAGKTSPVRVHGLPAVQLHAQAQTTETHLALEVTWVAWRGGIYRIEAGTPIGFHYRHAKDFARTAKSFRPLAPAQLARLDVLRLRLARARPGETLAELSRRVENAWDLPFTAVANQVSGTEPLPPGILVKVARRELYAAAPPEDPADARREAPGPGFTPP